MPREQLKALAKRVPDQYIGDNGRGMPAMEHTVVTQLLLAKLGPYSFDIVQVLQSGTKKNPERDVVTGVIGRLTVEVDGRTISIEEAGGIENADNQDGDGERLKHAISDALKRCCMRIGLGLHIWAQENYFLDRLLDRMDEGQQSSPGPSNVDEAPKPQAQPRAKEVPEEQAPEPPIPAEGDGGPSIASKSQRLKLADRIGRAGRSVDEFEKESGPISEISEDHCLKWIELLEHEIKKENPS